MGIPKHQTMLLPCLRQDAECLLHSIQHGFPNCSCCLGIRQARPLWISHWFNQILERSSSWQRSMHRPLAACLLLQPPQRCCTWLERSWVFRSNPGTHQLFGPHVVEDPLRVLAVMPALHDRQEQFWSIVLKGRKNNNNRRQESKHEGTQLKRYHPRCPEGLEIPGFYKYEPRARQSLPASLLQDSYSLTLPSTPSPLIIEVGNLVVFFTSLFPKPYLMGAIKLTQVKVQLSETLRFQACIILFCFKDTAALLQALDSKTVQLSFTQDTVDSKDSQGWRHRHALLLLTENYSVTCSCQEIEGGNGKLPQGTRLL